MWRSSRSYWISAVRQEKPAFSSLGLLQISHCLSPTALLSLSLSPHLSLVLSLPHPWSVSNTVCWVTQTERRKAAERVSEDVNMRGALGNVEEVVFWPSFLSLSLYSFTSSLPLSSEMLRFSTFLLWFTLQFPNYELPEVPSYICW